MALFDIEDAEIGNNYNREKLQPGTHVCRVLDVRENKGFKGKGFFIDFEVVSGPTTPAFRAAYIVFPDNAQGTARMPVERARKLELGKIKVAMAACFGWEAKGAELITNKVYNDSIARPVSPLKGRLITVHAIPHTNKQGKTTVFYEVTPHTEGQAPAEAPAPSTTPSVPTTPELPPAPTFPPAGWVVHPQNPAFFYKGQEVLSEVDLRARVA